MNPTILLLQLRARLIINRLRTLHRESHLKIIAVAVLGSLLWLGLFAMFHRGFIFLEQFLGLETYFTDAMLSLFFFSLLLMLTFSNAIISYSSLFRSRETIFLISCPINYDTIFLHKLAESITFSSWAFVILGLPMIVAYGVVSSAGAGFYLVMLVFFGIFVLIPAGLGAMAAFVISAAMPRRMTRFIWVLLGCLFILMVWFGMRMLTVPGDHAPYTHAWMDDILDKIRFTQNHFNPSYWVTRGLVRAANGDWAEALFQLGLLASNGLLITFVTFCASSKLYSLGWAKLQSGRERRQYSNRKWLRLTGPAQIMRLLIDKDFTIFRRDPVQWTQCAILFGLLGIYILNLRTFAFHNENALWRTWTAFLNLAATCLVLATLTTRFIYPLLSLEGKRFWVLGLLPIRRETILYSKFWFSLVTSLVVSETLIVLSNLMLKTSIEIMLVHVFTVALICGALSAMSVGMGALYPNFREDNPSKIVSGFGGTLNLILSLIYVVLVISLEAIPCQLYFSHQIQFDQLKFWAVVSVASILLLTVLAIVVPMKLGARAMRKMEV